MPFTNKNPEFFGYVIGKNIVPYINKCIEEAGECVLSEGTHIVGSSDNNVDVWKNNMISWGWSRKHGVKLTGAGRDRTTLKFANNLQPIKFYQKQFYYVFMLQTNYSESCNDCVIDGITFDGNYSNNKIGESTINCLRIRGERNVVKNCQFINFGVGDSSIYECFQVTLLAPFENLGGNQVINNLFTSPGKKDKAKEGFVPENTFIAVSGDNAVIKNNQFIDCECNAQTQRSSLHGITIGGAFPSKNAVIFGNYFKNYQGVCFYIDSWTTQNVEITDNEAENVWLFCYLSSQGWPNEKQISYSKDYIVRGNTVKLANEKAYYQFNENSSFEPIFAGYNNDPKVDRVKCPGFSNIVFEGNQIEGANKSYLRCFHGPEVGLDKITVRANTGIIDNLPAQLAQIQANINNIQNILDKINAKN